MFPILLISKKREAVENYLKDLVKGQFEKASIFHIKPSPNVIKIDQIRQIKRLLTRADKKKKLIIIYEFNTAKDETQNAFLKTLEEKADKTQFVVVVGDETQVLDTVISRCKVERLTIKEKGMEGKDMARWLRKDLSSLLLDYSNINKDKFFQICDDLLIYIRSRLRQKGLKKRDQKRFVAMIKETTRTKNLVSRNNVNPQAAMDHIIITFSKL